MMKKIKKLFGKLKKKKQDEPMKQIAAPRACGLGAGHSNNHEMQNF